MEKPKGTTARVEHAAGNLTEQEWKLECILEAAGIGAWQWNIQSGEAEYDERWASILGYTLDELTPMVVGTWENLVHPDDLARARALLDQHFAGTLPYYDCDLRMRHRDGHWVWVQDRGRVGARMRDGRPLLMFGAHVDISDRKQAEEAVLASERRYFLSLDVAPDAIFLIYDGQVCYANAAALSLLGARSLAELASTDYLDRLHPDSHALMRDMLRDLQGDSPEISQRQMKFLRMDGSEVDVECTAALVPINNKVVTEIVVRDITERMRAELALLHSHDLLQYILEHARSAVAVHDRDLNYLYVSQRYLQEYDVIEQDIIGRHHYEVFPDLPEKWRIVHQKALQGEVSSAENDPYERDDGTIVWTRWECRPWYETDGSIGGIIIYTEVINEQKRVEDRLLQYQKRLRALAAELVASGEREQRRLATELHDGVGQLLVAAKMEAQILGGETADPDTRERAQRLTDLLVESINEVRSLTAQLAPTVLLGRGLAGSLRWLSERYADLYGLHCVVRVDRTAEDQSLDSKLLIFRVVREALNNVARHSETDRAVVTVRHGNGRLSVSITDHGVGFEPEGDDDSVISRHFGLFSINEECLVRGGSVDVWSSPGKGTKVRAWFPDNLDSLSLD